MKHNVLYDRACGCAVMCSCRCIHPRQRMHAGLKGAVPLATMKGHYLCCPSVGAEEGCEWEGVKSSRDMGVDIACFITDGIMAKKSRVNEGRVQGVIISQQAFVQGQPVAGCPDSR